MPERSTAAAWYRPPSGRPGRDGLARAGADVRASHGSGKDGPILEARGLGGRWLAEAYGHFIETRLRPQVMVSIHPRFTLAGGQYAMLTDRIAWFYRSRSNAGEVEIVEGLQRSMRGGNHAHVLVGGDVGLAAVKWKELWADLRFRCRGLVGDGQQHRLARVGVGCDVCGESHDGIEQRPLTYDGDSSNTAFVNFRTNDGGSLWQAAFSKYVARYITREEADTWVRFL